MEAKKLARIIGGILLCALFLYSAYFQLYIHDYTGFRERWLQCLDYIAEGTFWSGQPYCDGGPLVYYIAYATRFVVGQELFQGTMIVESLLLCIGLFYFLHKAYEKERENASKKTFLLAALFGFLVYVNTLTEFETALMTFCLFAGYYFLFYLGGKQKEWIAGIFFAIAMLSKFSALIPFGLIGICYIFKERIVQYKEKKLTIEKNVNRWMNGIKIILPTILGYIYFRIQYEYFFIYLFLVQTKQEIALSILETIKTFLTLNFENISINFFPLLFLIVLCWYEFYCGIKKQQSINPDTFLAAVGLPLSIFLIIKSFGIPKYFLTDFRYWVPFMPFVILCIMKLHHRIEEEKKSVHRAICTAFLVTILIFPGAYYSPLIHPFSPINFVVKLHPYTQEKFEIMNKLNYGYSIIPEQEGRVLVEWGLPHYIDEMYAQFNISIPREKLFSITNTMAPTHPDVWQLPRFQELLGENLIDDSDTTDELTTAEMKISKEIENGTYSLILYGLPNFFVTGRILSTLQTQNALFGCKVYVPSNIWLDKEGIDYVIFVFSNPEDCSTMKKRLVEFYVSNFDYYCSLDTYSVQSIKNNMYFNEVQINKECISGGEKVLPFFKENIPLKNWQFFIMLILLFSCIVWYIPKIIKDCSMNIIKVQKEDKECQTLEPWETKKEQILSILKRQRMEKIFFYSILLLLVLLMIYVSLHLDYTRPFQTPVVT